MILQQQQQHRQQFQQFTTLDEINQFNRQNNDPVIHEIYDKFDPIMYDIYVCPSCFFASTISEFDKLKAREMEILFNNKRVLISI